MNSGYNESDEAVKEVREYFEAYDVRINDLVSERDELIKQLNTGMELYGEMLSHWHEYENLAEFYLQKSQAELSFFNLNEYIWRIHSEMLKMTIEAMNMMLSKNVRP